MRAAHFVELGIVDTTKQGLENAKAAVAAFGSSVTKLGAGIAGLGGSALAFLTAGLPGLVEASKEIKGFSERTGVAFGAASELRAVFGEIELPETAVRKMQQFLAEVSGGSESAQKRLDGLGLSLADLLKMSVADQFTAVGKAVAGVAPAFERTAAAVDVFGKTGTQLLPKLGNLAEAREKMKELGLTLSAETVAAAAAFGKSLGLFKSQTKAVWTNLSAALVPGLGAFVSMSQPYLAKLIEIIRQNQDWVQVAGAAAFATTAFGTALAALGGYVALAGRGLGVLSSVAGLVLAPFKAAAGAVWALVSGLVGLAAKAALKIVLLPVTGVQTALSLIKSGVSAVAGVFGAVGDAASAAFGVVKGVAEAAASVVAGTFNFFSSGIAGTVAVVKIFANSIGLVQQGIEAVTKIASSGVAAVVNWVGALGSVTGVLVPLAAAALTVGAAFGAFKLGEGIVGGAKAAGQAAAGAAADAFDSVKARAADTLPAVWSSVQSGAASAFASVKSTALAAWGSVRTTGMAVWPAISDAVKGGRWGEVMTLATAAIQVEWAKLSGWLTQRWIDLKETFSGVALSIADLMSDAWAGIESAWVRTSSFIERSIKNLTRGMVANWEIATGIMEGDAEKVARGVAMLADPTIAQEDDKRLEKERDDRLAAIDARKAERKDMIGNMQEMLKIDFGVERGEAAAKAAAEVARAQAELDAAVAAAGPKGGLGARLARAALKFGTAEQIGPGVQQAAARGEAVGTFSASIAGQITGKNLDKDMLDVQKQIERNTREQGRAAVA